MRLYKFLSIDHAVDGLVKRRIKISEYHDMNDPFELLAVSVSLEPYRQIMVEVIKTGGAVCFSETESDPLLWSHYAEKHQGCCIAFEVAESSSLRRTIPIQKPTEIYIDISPLVEIKRNALSVGLPVDTSGPEFERLVEEHTRITDEVMLSKYNGWDYEKEVRLLINLIDSQKDGKLYFADFDDKLRPTEVLLGARCTQDHEARLRYAVNRYEPPLPIIKMCLATDDFKIVRQKH
jgi:hypothetical protein